MSFGLFQFYLEDFLDVISGRFLHVGIFPD
jgi:hypothetical protein